jgi:hypothetical protein
MQLFFIGPGGMGLAAVNLGAASPRVIHRLFFASPVAWDSPTSGSGAVRKIIRIYSGRTQVASFRSHFLDANSADGVVGEFAERVRETRIPSELVYWDIIADFIRIANQQFRSPDS